jgi:hypothetical protein
MYIHTYSTQKLDKGKFLAAVLPGTDVSPKNDVFDEKPS